MNRFRKAKNELEEFNRLVHRDDKLRALLVEGKYDYLQWYQQSLFTFFLEPKTSLKRPKGSVLGFYLQAFFSLLFSTFSWLLAVLMRRRVLVFGIDKANPPKGRDFRVEGLYAWLDKNKVRYFDVLHTLFGKRFFERLMLRRRFVLHQEAIDLIWAFFSVNRRRRRGKKAIIEMIRNWKERSDFRMRTYRFLLRLLPVRTVLSIDDVRHYNELVAVCNEMKIPFHAFQHGHFTTYHAGWLKASEHPLRTQPDVYHVWSPFWKQQFLQLGGCYDADRLHIGGNPKGQSAELKPWIAPKEEIGILMGYENEAIYEEVRPYLRKILELEGVKIYFSLRPDILRKRQFEMYGFDGEEGIEVVQDLASVLDRIHVVVGTHSTFLYDMIRHGKTVVYLETSLDLGHALVEGQLVDVMTEHDDAETFLKTVIKNAPETVPMRQKRVYDDEGDLSRTLEDVVFGEKQA